MEARPYQTEGNNKIMAAWSRGQQSVLYVLPTGGGKTFTFTELARTFVNSGLPVLVLATRIELVKQTAEKVKSANLNPGIIQGNTKRHPERLIQVASVLSLDLNNLPPAKLIIFDEAHWLTPHTARTIWNSYPDAWKLGVTATPISSDEEQGLADLFDVMIVGATTRQLIDQNYLSNYRLITPAIEDAQIGQVSGDIVKTWKEHTPGALTIVFCSSIPNSKIVANIYKKAGIPAAHIDGTYMRVTERRKILADFKKRKHIVLTNCNLLGEGIDIPELECIQNLSEIRSLRRWLQICGRVLRYVPGKMGRIIDHTPTWFNKGLPDEDRDWFPYFKGIKFDTSDIQDENRLYNEKVNNGILEVKRTDVIYNPGVKLIQIDVTPRFKEEIDQLNQIRLNKRMIPYWIVYRLEESLYLKRLSFGDWRYVSQLVEENMEWVWMQWNRYSDDAFNQIRRSS